MNYQFTGPASFLFKMVISQTIAIGTRALANSASVQGRDWRANDWHPLLQQGRQSFAKEFALFPQSNRARLDDEDIGPVGVEFDPAPGLAHQAEDLFHGELGHMGRTPRWTTPPRSFKLATESLRQMTRISARARRDSALVGAGGQSGPRARPSRPPGPGR